MSPVPKAVLTLTESRAIEAKANGIRYKKENHANNDNMIKKIDFCLKKCNSLIDSILLIQKAGIKKTTNKMV